MLKQRAKYVINQFFFVPLHEISRKATKTRLSYKKTVLVSNESEQNSIYYPRDYSVHGE